MLRTVVNYLRSCFCKHNVEHIQTVRYFDQYSDIPYKMTICYRCNKCGYVQKIKL